MAGVVVTVRPSDSICCCAAAGRAGRTKAVPAARKRVASVPCPLYVTSSEAVRLRQLLLLSKKGRRQLPPPPMVASGQALAVLGDVEALALLLLRDAEADDD